MSDDAEEAMRVLRLARDLANANAQAFTMTDHTARLRQEQEALAGVLDEFWAEKATAEQPGPHHERERYMAAVEMVIADREKPTDARVAEKLELNEKTIRRWRRLRFIP